MKKILLSVLVLVSATLFAQAQTKHRATNGSTFTPLQLVSTVTKNDYKSGVLIVRIKPEYRAVCSANAIQSANLEVALRKIGGTSIQQIFPNHQPPAQTHNALGQAYADISLIYRIAFDGANVDVVTAANTVLQTGLAQYAEPDYIYALSAFTPNDPSFSQQTYMARIKATDAWDLAQGGSQGDTTVVIGIVDSGSDTDHPDLAANVKINWADPINGLDDDNDGYIDNHTGWDLGGADYAAVVQDNNPNITGANNNHGSHVSGDAAAVANNGIGVAGTGFKCKFLPVKCAADNDTRASGGVGYIIAGYDGITYAADHGCAVINCSWGGTGGGQFGQDIVTYATINKNALVVCAAGNAGIDQLQFPSGYDYAFSVAATNSNNDTRASFTTYNYSVDISAPGNGIYNTLYDNSYGSESGTSMASPITAGAAALVKAKYPTLSALQIGEKLRVTSDNHYTGTNNTTAYRGKLGKGRLNMFRALTINLPSVRMQPIVVTDNNDGAFVANEVLDMKGTFTNFLAPTTNLVATISTTSTDVTIQTATVNLGAIGTLGSANNNANPFKLKINAGAAANARVDLKITLTDGATYSDFQYLTIIVNVDYINVHQNQIGTTITSKGRTGYNGTGQQEGLGFIYRDSSLLYEMGFLAGTSGVQLSDNIRGVGAVYNDAWVSQNRVLINTTNPISEKDLYGKFNDNNAATPLGAVVDHRFFAWSNPGDDKYVIVEYKFHNTSATPWTNFYVGLFADWDIQTFANNKCDEVPALKLGYSYHTAVNGLYGGMKVLSHTPFNHYGLDNIPGGGGGLDLGDTDGYSLADKYTTLSTGRAQGGTATAQGGDVHDVVSTGPFTVAAGDSITVAFALLGGDDLADLSQSATNAQIKYDGVILPTKKVQQKTFLAQNVPNPVSTATQIIIDLPEAADIALTLNDITGKQLQQIYSGRAAEGTHTYDLNLASLPNGTYVYTLTSGNQTFSQRLIVLH